MKQAATYLRSRPRRAAAVALAMGAGAFAVLGAGCGGHDEPADAAPVTARPAALSDDPIPPRPRPTEPLSADATCINAGCHASFETARVTHGAILSRDGCAVCHENDQGEHVFPLRRQGNETCTFCHDNVIGTRLHQHGATEVTCTGCHDPHASEHTSLRRAALASDLCMTCHPRETHAVPHGPFETGACVACHDPHESDFPGLLRSGVGAEHCFGCHDDVHDAMTGSAHVHAPAAQDCRICHHPHGSDHPFALERPIDETCYACHGGIEELIAGATAPHGAVTVQNQCANCHDSHASDHPSLLRDRQDVVCLSCHAETITTPSGRTIPGMTATLDRAFLHGPIRSGDCTACHSVHGASHSRLLRAEFTESFYASFDLDQYALCFECHESELVTADRTVTLTNFRDGDLNLHYLHVNRQEKGRTCRTCHEIHGSDLPGHVADTVPFEGSGWALPIGFEKTDTGGTCTTGCHQKLGYDRTATRLPAAPAPEATPAPAPADQKEGSP